jgi:hypothetical protein
VDGDAADILAAQLDLAGVRPGADLDPEGLDRVAQRLRAVERSRRGVERAQGAVAHELDHRAAVEPDLAADGLVVAV